MMTNIKRERGGQAKISKLNEDKAKLVAYISDFQDIQAQNIRLQDKLLAINKLLQKHIYWLENRSSVKLHDFYSTKQQPPYLGANAQDNIINKTGAIKTFNNTNIEILKDQLKMNKIL